MTNGFDFAIFCAGGEISQKFAPIAVKKECIVIDNSSVFRMDNTVPLVVPEVNSIDILTHSGIIANPNCSTIQAVVALKPLDIAYQIRRIVYSTYQSVSGAGQAGLNELINTTIGLTPQKFSHPIFNNCLPQIDIPSDNGYYKEEIKLIQETQKILHNPNLKVTATAVRVPVMNCHCEAINIEFEKDFNLKDLIKILKNSEGIIVVDDFENNVYPIPTEVTGKDSVFVGRIRRDFSVPFGVNLWVVADNIRKGAATNAIQILEYLL